MSRIPLIDPTSTTPERQALLGQVHAAFGATPAMFRAVANSPAALQSMWGSFGALGAGRLPPLLDGIQPGIGPPVCRQHRQCDSLCARQRLDQFVQFVARCRRTRSMSSCCCPIRCTCRTTR